MGTKQKNVVTALIHMFTKWQHFHLGTEPKTVVASLIQLFKKTATSPFGHRNQDFKTLSHH